MGAEELKARDIKESFDRAGVELAQEQALQLERFYRLLVENNKKYNLTTLTAPSEVLEGHFMDSILGAVKMEGTPANSLLDLGTGGGFPGVPLKILYPQLKLYLLESSRKKVLFLRLLKRELGLKNLELIFSRAEEYGQGQGREFFPWVAARAVANLPVLLEIALPLVKTGGVFWAYKGPYYEEELQKSMLILQKCGGVFQNIVWYGLPGSEKRTLLEFKKTSAAESQFPRRPGLPQKKPFF